MGCRCSHGEGRLTSELEEYFTGLEQELDHEVDRKSRGYVRWIQRSLNRLIAAGLSEDGVSGQLTRSAVSRFQSQAGLATDGVVGPQTEAALIRAGASPPDAQSGALPSSGSSPVGAGAPAWPAPAPSAGAAGTSGLTQDAASVRANAVRIAQEEYARWRPGGTMIKEVSAAAKPYLERYWMEGVKLGARDAATAISKQTAWSAAFISWVMRAAGAGTAFSYSGCHATYIKAAKTNRTSVSSNPIKAYRVTEFAPRLGDLVCKCRESCEANYDNVGTGTGCMPTHCDVVVEISPGSIRTIGGNLSDSVGSTPVSIDSQGRVTQAGYFAVIAVGGAEAGSSAPSTGSDAAAPSTGAAGAAPAASVRGANAFGRLFESTSVGRADTNAYLLAYLSTMVYADYGLANALPEYSALSVVQRAEAEYKLQTDEALFKREFERLTRPFFYDAAQPLSATNSPPRYEYRTNAGRIEALSSIGVVLDPEAMVINTPKAVYVVFRGTDRIGGLDPDNAGYEVGEWLSTNILAFGATPGSNLRGQVHSGIWNSLSALRDRLAQDVIEAGGRTKPVWVTGHSLGAAQGILFSAFLAAQHGIRPAGTYAFAAPRIGDSAFVASVEQFLTRGRIQRFEFIVDPVAVLPPRKAEIPELINSVASTLAGAVSALTKLQVSSEQYPEYYTPGIRNYYNSVTQYLYDARERSPDELKQQFRQTPPWKAFCFHYPQWYLVAAYKQLPEAQRPLVPTPIALPKPSSLGCALEEIARGLEPA